MTKREHVTLGPDGRWAPLRRAATPAEAGRALAPGLLVEVSAETAAACGACREACASDEEAFAATGHPAEFGDEDPVGASHGG